MKKNLLMFLKFLGSTLLNAIFIVGLILGISWLLPNISLLSNSRILTPAIPTASVSLPVSGTPAPLNYDDALHTYEVVATTAIQSSERALNLMVAMFTAFIGLAALAAAAASYLYNTTREADERAKSAEISAQAAKAAAENANQQLNTLSTNYIELNNRFTDILQNYIEIRNQTLSLDAAIQAREKGEISEERQIESEQWRSWHKWMDMNDQTGWHELKERKNQGKDLVPAVRIAIELEMARAFRGKQDSKLTEKEKTLKNRLISLLEIKKDGI